MSENYCSQCQECTEPCMVGVEATIPVIEINVERTSITEYSTQELKQLHYELWNWLIDNPDKQKKEWPKFEELPKDLTQHYYRCFACASIDNINGCTLENFYCKKCPLKVPKELQKEFGNKICADREDVYSMFELWCDSNVQGRTERQNELATIIRDSWK